jgi:hypothetical protein
MDTFLHVVDNFLEDPLQVRAAALAGGFDTVEFAGHKYTGVGPRNQPDLKHAISKAVGIEIQPVISFFRRGMPQDETTHWIHADTICAQYASILYLNLPEQCHGGTAFRYHNELNWDRIPPEARTRDQAFFDRLNEDGNDASKWRFAGFVAMKWNRFIAYPTNVFHSRWPREGWGETEQNARLIWVCFFNQA